MLCGRSKILLRGRVWTAADEVTSAGDSVVVLSARWRVEGQ